MTSAVPCKFEKSASKSPGDDNGVILAEVGLVSLRISKESRLRLGNVMAQNLGDMSEERTAVDRSFGRLGLEKIAQVIEARKVHRTKSLERVGSRPKIYPVSQHSEPIASRSRDALSDQT